MTALFWLLKTVHVPGGKHDTCLLQYVDAADVWASFDAGGCVNVWIADNEASCDPHSRSNDWRSNFRYRLVIRKPPMPNRRDQQTPPDSNQPSVPVTLMPLNLGGVTAV